MRDFLPIFGTASLLALVAGAGYLVSLAPDRRQEQEPLSSVVEASSDSTAGTLSADLVPRARPDVFYAAITDRPLFAQSRRPEALKPVTTEKEAPEPVATETPPPVEEAVLPEPNAVLLGVLTGGARSTALISLDGAEAEWRRVGDDIAGWRLDAIEADAIRLNETDRSLKIDLYQK